MSKTENKVLAVSKERLTLAKAAKETQWAMGDNMRDKDCFLDIPTRNKALVKGKYWDTVIKTLNDGLVRRSSNQIAPKLDAKIAILEQGTTEFYLEPTKLIYREATKQAEGLLNYTWEDKQVDRVIVRLQKDVEIYGFGVAEIGWRFERDGKVIEGQRGEPNPVGDIPLTPEVLDMFESNPAITQSDFDSPEQAQAIGMAAIEHADNAVWNVTYDDIFINRVSPRLFYVDPNATCSDLSDASYVIKTEFIPLNQVKFNDTYSKERRNVVGGVYSDIYDLHEVNVVNPSTRSDCALVQLHHIYGYFDVNDNGKDTFLHVVFTTELDTPLLVEEIAYDFGSSTPFPFRVLAGTNFDNDEFYPESSINQVADLQLDYDEAFSQLNNFRRKGQRMYLVEKGSLDAKSIKKIEIGKDNSVIEVEPGFIQSLKPLPQIPPVVELYNSMSLIPNEIQRGLGVTEFAEGITPTKDMTARETIAIQNSGNSRINGSYEHQQDLKKDLAYCLLCLYQQFADRDFQFPTKDKQGNTGYASVNALTLRGENPISGELNPVGIQFKVKINSDAVTQANKGTKAAEQERLLTVLAPYISAGAINPMPIIKRYLELTNQDNVDEIMNTGNQAPPSIPPVEGDTLPTDTEDDSPLTDTTPINGMDAAMSGEF